MDAFEDLEVWQRSKAPAVRISNSLHDRREWVLKDQVTRSAVSI